MAGTVWATRITIYDKNLDRLFVEGGQAYEWLESVGREHLAMALIEAPQRTGHLRSMHNLSLTPVGHRIARYTVGNYAEYAGYVHAGTRDDIQAGNGFWDDGRRAYMGPMAPWMGRDAVYRHTVNGQEANPWIANAADIVLAKYGYQGNAYPY